MKKHKVISFLVLGAVLMVVFASCLYKEPVDACLQGHRFGFWGGLWHGIIAPFNLIVMIFRDDVAIFAQHNSGFWYAFGFLLGSGGWGILGGKSSSYRKGRKRD